MRSNLPLGWLGIGPAAFLYCAPAAAQPSPRFELEVDLADEVSLDTPVRGRLAKAMSALLAGTCAPK